MRHRLRSDPAGVATACPSRHCWAYGNVTGWRRGCSRVSTGGGGAAGAAAKRLAARADVIGVYVYGSLMTGDYSPAASDIDVVVLMHREPDQAVTRELTELQTALASTGGPVSQLHCRYVAADTVSDPERLCTYW